MFSFLDGDQLRQSGMVLQALVSHAACWRENKGCKSSLFDNNNNNIYYFNNNQEIKKHKI